MSRLDRRLKRLEVRQEKLIREWLAVCGTDKEYEAYLRVRAVSMEIIEIKEGKA